MDLLTPLVVCVGNRHHPGDDLGPRVHDRLTAPPGPPADITVVDGGLAGLNLLSLLAGRARVVFVDRVDPALAPDGGPVILTGDQVAALATGYGHNGGLPFLLAMLPQVMPPPWPRCLLVGAAGAVDEPVLDRLARTTLQVARDDGDPTP